MDFEKGLVQYAPFTGIRETFDMQINEYGIWAQTNRRVTCRAMEVCGPFRYLRYGANNAYPERFRDFPTDLYVPQ